MCWLDITVPEEFRKFYVNIPVPKNPFTNPRWKETPPFLWQGLKLHISYPEGDLGVIHEILRAILPVLLKDNTQHKFVEVHVHDM